MGEKLLAILGSSSTSSCFLFFTLEQLEVDMDFMNGMVLLQREIAGGQRPREIDIYAPASLPWILRVFGALRSRLGRIAVWLASSGVAGPMAAPPGPGYESRRNQRRGGHTANAC
jgi:hypothetical protein